MLRMLAVCLMISGMLFGCTDIGSNPPGSAPVISAVVPDSGSVGDTIRIVGSGFGAVQGSSLLSVSGIVASGVLQWTDTLIYAVVPAGASTGSVTITVAGKQSNAVAFRIVSASSPAISFSVDIQPIFSQNGCTGCHGGSGGLSLTAGQSYANLVNVQAQAGCTNRKRVLPGNADESVLYLRLAGSACGDRMPKGGSAVSSASVTKVRDWINGGAPNN